MIVRTTLVAIAERKFSDFFQEPDRFEASDIIIIKTTFYTSVFDNFYQIGKIRVHLIPKRKATNSSGKLEEGLRVRGNHVQSRITKTLSVRLA